jgi:DNA-binding beta-propeller fold protein YncE
VYRIDPATRAITQDIAVGAGAGGIAYGEGDVWVANASAGTVSRIAGLAGQVVQTIGTGSEPTGVAVGLGAVWVTDPVGSTVSRIDPVAGQPVQTISVGADPDAIAYGFGSVWVANGLDSTVSRIDPGTGIVTPDDPRRQRPLGPGGRQRRSVGGEHGGRHGRADRSSRQRGLEPARR